jgi:hypothetical protein
MKSKLSEQTRIMNLIEELINEVGDLTNIKPFDFKFRGDDGYFYIDEKTEVVMFYNQLSNENKSNLNNYNKILEIDKNPIFDIGFSVNGEITQAVKGDLKLLNKILKTVLIYAKHVIDIIEDNYKEYKPIFLIGSQAKNTKIFKDDEQKMEYYTYIILNNLPDTYRKYTGKYKNKTVLMIQKLR